MRHCCRRLPLFEAGALALAAAAATLACPARARAQAPAPPPQAAELVDLVNLDVPAVRPPGGLAARLEVRAFRGNEELVYTSVAAHYGVADGWEALVRGAFSGRRSLGLPGGAGAIRHGGTDVEVAARYVPPRANRDDRYAYAAQVGVSFAGTPAQDASFLTLGAMASARVGAVGAVFLNPRAVLIEDNAIVGVGIGGAVRLSERFLLLGDYTPMVAGDNTRDTTTGLPRRRDVYGFGLRFAPGAPGAGGAGDRWDVEIGYTNAAGRTTGFGLTPGLGDSGAFYAAIGYSR